LTELSKNLGRPATLDDIPDGDLDHLAEKGFDWIWLLSVWRTGMAGQRISRTNAEWRREFEETLPDLRERNIAGSGFAITGYVIHAQLGGDAALARLRDRLRVRGLRLLLDFVPNHTGLDHPLVEEHPNQSQCFVRLPFTDLDGGQWRLEDRMQGTAYDRDGRDLQRRGLYLDVRPWQASVFTLTRNPS